MYRKILAAYDGSDAGRRAFDAALNLSARHGAELVVVTVAQPPIVGDEVETEAVIENSRNYHQGLLAELAPVIAETRVQARYVVAVGHPAEQIIYHADQHGVDLIVVGDRGRSKLARLLLGSVSRHVVERAGRPVMVVR